MGWASGPKSEAGTRPYALIVLLDELFEFIDDVDGYTRIFLALPDMSSGNAGGKVRLGLQKLINRQRQRLGVVDMYPVIRKVCRVGKSPVCANELSVQSPRYLISAGAVVGILFAKLLHILAIKRVRFGLLFGRLDRFWAVSNFCDFCVSHGFFRGAIWLCGER